MEDKQIILSALEKSVRAAIAKIGIKQFKACSFFMSNKDASSDG